MINLQALKDLGFTEKLAIEFVKNNPTLQNDVFWTYYKKDDPKLRDSSIEQSFDMAENFDKTSPMETPGIIHRHVG